MKAERVIELLGTVYPSFEFKVICFGIIKVSKKENNIEMLFVVDGEKRATKIFEKFKRKLLMEILY